LTVTGSTKFLAADGQPLLSADLTPGDRLVVRGLPDVKDPTLYRAEVIRDRDVAGSSTLTGLIAGDDHRQRTLILHARIFHASQGGRFQVVLIAVPGSTAAGNNQAEGRAAALRAGQLVRVSGPYNVRTRTLVRLASIALLPPPLSLSFSPDDVAPGRTAVAAIHAPPAVPVSLTVTYPNGDGMTVRGRTTRDGIYDARLPVSAAVAPARPSRARAVAAATLLGVPVQVAARFSIQPVVLRLSVDHPTLRSGQVETVRIVTAPGVQVLLSLTWPHGRRWTRTESSGVSGIVAYPIRTSGESGRSGRVEVRAHISSGGPHISDTLTFRFMAAHRSRPHRHRAEMRHH
jgi:hypothetical protein